MSLEIQHVNLTANHRRTSTINDVSTEAVAKMKQWISKAVDAKKGHTLLHDEEGRQYRIELHRVCDCLMCLMSEDVEEEITVPLVAICMAPASDRTSRVVWEAMAEDDLNPKAPGPVDKGPWSIMSITRDAIKVKPMDWILQFEDSLAWAWLSFLTKENEEA